MRDTEFCEITLASVDCQKFKAHKVIISASSIFFKKQLVNNLNHHPLLFMRKIEDESHMLHQFTLKKTWKKPGGIELLELNKIVLRKQEEKYRRSLKQDLRAVEQWLLPEKSM